jgi:hypothetical protein
MAEVHLRPVTLDNYLECIRLQVEDTQAEFVAPNARSLALSKTWPSSNAPRQARAALLDGGRLLGNPALRMPWHVIGAKKGPVVQVKTKCCQLRRRCLWWTKAVGCGRWRRGYLDKVCIGIPRPCAPLNVRGIMIPIPWEEKSRGGTLPLGGRFFVQPERDRLFSLLS